MTFLGQNIEVLSRDHVSIFLIIEDEVMIILIFTRNFYWMFKTTQLISDKKYV